MAPPKTMPAMNGSHGWMAANPMVGTSQMIRSSTQSMMAVPITRPMNSRLPVPSYSSLDRENADLEMLTLGSPE